jgi:tetratricopeptide (TPR) repeat protein
MRILLAVAMILIAGNVHASVRSKMLYSRGVIELNAGRTQAALDLFNQAVAADPTDGYALYYRGVTRGQMQDHDGAIADLTAALNAQPTLSRAALELGIALVQKEDYDDAVVFLERARKTPELEGRASFFLGICRLRRGEYAEARRLFDRAAAEDPQLANSSHYYRGVIAYREGDRPEAIEHFQTVVDKTPDSPIGQEAKKLVDTLQATARPWQLFAGTGLQYDSNVILGPGDTAEVTGGDPEFVSGAGDGRAVFNLGGKYRLIDREWVSLSGGYDFYQSVHFGLGKQDELTVDSFGMLRKETRSCCTDDNIQNHGAVVDLGFFSDYVDGGLLARHDFALRETSKFLQSGTILPWISVPMPGADWAESQLSFRLLINDFYGGGDDEDFDVRDAYNYAAAIREVFNVGAARYVWLGYRFDNEDPVGDDDASESFGYSGHQVETGFSWTLPSAYGVEAGYAYRNESYNDASRIPPPPLPAFPERPRRSDNVHNVFVLLHIPLPSVFELTCGFFSTFNNSNQAEFSYDRLVGTISIAARL